jgi:hypothetical protein
MESRIVGKARVEGYSLAEVEEFEASESFQSMGEVYARRADRARSRAVKRKALAKGRAVLAEVRRGACRFALRNQGESWPPSRATGRTAVFRSAK